MSFLKFRASQLFTGRQMLSNDHVLITDAKGQVSGIVRMEEAGDDVQVLEGVLSPGFINCHCHLELSHMKGLIPEQTGLVDFVFKVVMERHHPEETIQSSIAYWEARMKENGIVAVGDICNNLTTLAPKSSSDISYYNFIEVSGWLPALARERFERSKSFYDAFEKISNDTIRNAIVPHAPYSVSGELWELIEPCFEGKTISIHNQETAFEDELFSSGTGGFTRMYDMMKLDRSFFKPTGKSSLQSYLHRLARAGQVILVHNTYTQEDDIRYAQNTLPNINWCLCVNANRFIENALPPVDTFRKNNARMVIGTDSLASNHSLSVLDELKTIHLHFASVPLEEMLTWATLNGARALQMEERLGSFEKGKTPGVILLQQTNGDIICDSTTITRIL